MPRTVRSAHALDPGPADAAARGLARGPRLWLPEAARRCVDGWLLPVGVGRITRTVHLEIGPPTRAEGQVTRVLGWVPLRPGAAAVDRALPSFQGRLRLDLGTDDLPAVVSLTGEYEPPGGKAGRSVDRLVMQHVASHTVTSLLADLVPGLVAAGRAGAAQPVAAG